MLCTSLVFEGYLMRSMDNRDYDKEERKKLSLIHYFIIFIELVNLVVIWLITKMM
jgi:hypothetical protein